MMKLFRVLKYACLLYSLSVIFSCENDFNNLESDVIGEENINFNASKTALNVLAYNKRLDSLQINNLNSSLLGFFNDPLYGETTGSIVTQLSPAVNAPAFGNTPVIDSVILNIPYFSRITGTSSAPNVPLYALDSVFGNKNAGFKLSIYKNNFLLRDFNPNSATNEAQKYYSNASNNDKTSNFAITETQTINFDANKGELLYQNNNFIPSNKAIILLPNTTPTTAQAPALRLNLVKSEDNTINDVDKINFWTNLILNQEGLPTLSNLSNFNNHFRGLYIKAEAKDNDGQILLLNTNAANISIYFSNTGITPGTTPTNSPYVLTFGQNILNPYINTFTQTLSNGDRATGDSQLFLKGTEGSMAILDIFNGLINCDETNTNETAIDCFKKTYRQRVDTGYILKSGETEDENGYALRNGNFILKRVINEAQLIVFEDESIVTDNAAHENDRVYVYDIKNNIPIIDHSTDGSDSSLGLRETDTNGASKYKIRITEHLNSIILRDSTNTKLGLILSNNVDISNSSEILKSNDVVTSVPTAKILSPRGTVLHGSNSSAIDKRIRLEIFSTESNQ